MVIRPLKPGRKWRNTVEDPKAFLSSDRIGIKRHLPLLYRNLMTQHVNVGRDLEPTFGPHARERSFAAHVSGDSSARPSVALRQGGKNSILCWEKA